MAFFVYDDSTRSRFDLITQKQLNRVAAKFGKIELKELPESREWCIRVVIPDDDDEHLPLAALGDTAYEAAERMLRMVQSYGNDDNEKPADE